MPQFSFDDLDILGANKTMVYVKGEHFDDDESNDDPIPCILVFKRSLMNKALKCWLDDKAIYNGEFFGVMGSVRATNFTEREKERRRATMLDPNAVKDDTDEDLAFRTPVPFRTFEITEFDSNTDMEHG
jgi:hypothetical protein